MRESKNKKEKTAEKNNTDVDLSEFPENDIKVYKIIKETPSTPDRICELSSLDASDVMTSLTMLEIAGLIRPLAGGKFEA